MASVHRAVLQIDLIGSPAETDPSALSMIRKRGGQMHGLHLLLTLYCCGSSIMLLMVAHDGLAEHCIWALLARRQC